MKHFPSEAKWAICLLSLMGVVTGVIAANDYIKYKELGSAIFPAICFGLAGLGYVITYVKYKKRV
ncbi:hypothetical protein MUN82_08605 [Hymenobacter aerilatus]|uniref:Uncharacterized protein n=1 Tax=Hymenobacter aerilatus TaxID=2932251 RepID=A0A8T9T2F3_9BACT|nr:hypothetical protein [Hymenobacter aerilatus]UOR07143.1 hypothetical protein MUN82_08605 [Hymenobacter aerilatus]